MTLLAKDLRMPHIYALCHWSFNYVTLYGEFPLFSLSHNVLFCRFHGRLEAVASKRQSWVIQNYFARNNFLIIFAVFCKAFFRFGPLQLVWNVNKCSKVIFASFQIHNQRLWLNLRGKYNEHFTEGREIMVHHISSKDFLGNPAIHGLFGRNLYLFSAMDVSLFHPVQVLLVTCKVKKLHVFLIKKGQDLGLLC